MPFNRGQAAFCSIECAGDDEVDDLGDGQQRVTGIPVLWQGCEPTLYDAELAPEQLGGEVTLSNPYHRLDIRPSDRMLERRFRQIGCQVPAGRPTMQLSNQGGVFT